MKNEPISLITIKDLLLRYVSYPYRVLISYKEKRKENYLINKIPINHLRALSALKGKEKIRCVFFAIFPQIWKYDDVYKLMVEHPRFEPVILVCPFVRYGRETMLETMDECYNQFKSKNYNVLKAYDESKDVYYDVEELSPDIIFYTNPYKGLIDDRYYITKYKNNLTVYVPYMYGNNNDFHNFHDALLHNVVWRFYAESDDHKNYSINASRCKGRNVVVTGYPGIERYIDSSYLPSEKNWKKEDQSLKKIIWAPHHTIYPIGNVNYSCFLKYSDFMLAMAQKYAAKAQFVFKPHPLLRDKLYKFWGVEKTNSYYNKWLTMDNCTVDNGEYVDLFLTSDAMIHDSGSFVIEYLYVNKPVMRTLNNEPIETMFNSFALKCLDNYYMGRCEQDIEHFIKNVIDGIDPMKEKRTRFVNEELIPKGSPSQNIINDLLDSIDNQILYRN